MGSKKRKMIDSQKGPVGEILVVTENGVFLHAYSSIPVHVFHVDLADIAEEDLLDRKIDLGVVASVSRSTEVDEECLTVNPDFNYQKLLHNAGKYLCSEAVLDAREIHGSEGEDPDDIGDFDATDDGVRFDDESSTTKYYTEEDMPSLPLPYTELLIAEAAAKAEAKAAKEMAEREKEKSDTAKVPQTAAADQDEISDL